MTDFFGLIGKESFRVGRDLINKLSDSCHSGSFRCYYGAGFDLSVYEDASLFVVSLGYLSSCRSRIHSLRNYQYSCAYNLAHLYSIHSDDFYDLVDGNFSFCIFDKIKKKTILARDKMGSRPLFVCFQEDYFLFSSNQKFLLNNDLVKVSLDNETMANYLALGHQQADKTFFNEIKRVTPFCVLFYENDSRKLAYRKYSFSDSRPATRNPVQDFKLKLEQAIKRCWRDTSRIGLMFSGGQDSSAIAAGLKTCGYSETICFSCNYSHLPESTKMLSDEAEYQDDVIKKLNLSHTQIQLKNDSPLQSLMGQFKYFAEPTHFPNLYMFEKVAIEAQFKKIDVIFDGQDGDTVISHGLQRFRELAQVGNIFVLLYELICYSRFHGFKFRSVFRNILIAILRNWGIIKHRARNNSVLNQRTFEKYKLGGLKNVTAVDSHLEKLCNPLHSIALETKYLIFKHHDIHVRSPFYDKDLMELCLNIPSKWKLRNGKTRYILRKYLSRMGLEKISCRRKKANLGYGLVDNIRRMDLEKIEDELKEVHPYLKDFINQAQLKTFFKDFKKNESWKDPELMGILAVFTANYWLKNGLNFKLMKIKEG